MIVEYRKVKCDSCGKEQTVKEPIEMPFSWLNINILENKNDYGRSVLDKDICSRQCALKFLHQLKKIPKGGRETMGYEEKTNEEK